MNDGSGRAEAGLGVTFHHAVIYIGEKRDGTLGILLSA
jgi:hypothetical protein